MEFEGRGGRCLESYSEWNKFLEGPEEMFGLGVLGTVGNGFKLDEEWG